MWHHHRVPNSASYLRRTGYSVWLLAIVLLFLLHFRHLSADFPGSGWSDPSAFTDEGWYFNAAARHALTGHWYQPGDFNLAVDLPLWAAVAAGVFYFTGVSIVSLRILGLVLVGMGLVCSAFLVRRHGSPWVALLVLSFAVSSPFFFVFSRLFLMESALFFLLSIAMLLADMASPASSSLPRAGLTLALGTLFVLMLLTKVTAVSLFPAVLCLLWYRLRRSPRIFVSSIAAIVAISAVGYGLYCIAVLNSRYRTDFTYYFSAASLSHPFTLHGWMRNGLFTLQDLWRYEPLLCVLAVVSLLLSLSPHFISIWSDSLFVASVLLVTCTTAFVFWRGYHAPHYYFPITVPLAMIASLCLARLVRANRAPAKLGSVAVAAIVLFSAWQTLALVRHPTFTFSNMANRVTAMVDQSLSSSRLLVAESGDQITLMTGLPSICDDFGTIPLRDEIAKRNPGWFAAWDAVNPDTLAELHTRYHLERVAVFPVSGDRQRSALLLYRLVPLSQPDTGVILQETTLRLYRRPKG